MMKVATKTVLFIFLLSGLLMSAIAGEGHGEKEIHMNKKAIEELGIRLLKVKKEPSGKLIRMPAEVMENPLLSSTIYSPVEGLVRKLYVKEGDRVRKGQALAEVYSPELADLIGEIEMARVRLDTARKIYERDKELYEQKVIQYTRFYTSQMEFERARGELRALERRLRSFGEVKDYHLVLRSPMDGYVVRQEVIQGDSVGPDRKLFDIHSHEIMWVYGWTDERSARELKPRMRAKIKKDGLEIPCLIDFIGHEVDRQTRRVSVRCIAKNREHLLKPGMFLTLEVMAGKEKAIVIPRRAIQNIEGEKIVFVRTKDGFEPREIETGREFDGLVVVKRGLKEGEEIAISGTVFLKTKLTGVEEGGHAH